MPKEGNTLPDYYRCGFTRDQLEGLVLKMRGVSSLEGDEALVLADIVAWDIIRMFEDTEIVRDEQTEAEEVDSWDLEEARSAVDRLNDEIREVQRYLKSGHIDVYSVEGLRDTINREKPHKDLTSLGQAGIDVMKKWKERAGFARDLADRAEVAFHETTIRKALDYDIASISSVKKIVRETSEAQEFLEKKGLLTNQHRADIRTAQERACRHRANKKLNQHKVAAAGGSEKRAERLLAEAQAFLEIDWGFAFPEETAPRIDAEE